MAKVPVKATSTAKAKVVKEQTKVVLSVNSPAYQFVKKALNASDLKDTIAEYEKAVKKAQTKLAEAKAILSKLPTIK